jgi:hypothetical protein
MKRVILFAFALIACPIYKQRSTGATAGVTSPCARNNAGIRNACGTAEAGVQKFRSHRVPGSANGDAVAWPDPSSRL